MVFSFTSLPDEHYAGVTCDPTYRMITHRKNGKDTSNWKIFFHTDEPAEALKVEAELHMLGFEGMRKIK